LTSLPPVTTSANGCAASASFAGDSNHYGGSAGPVPITITKAPSHAARVQDTPARIPLITMFTISAGRVGLKLLLIPANAIGERDT